MSQNLSDPVTSTNYKPHLYFWKEPKNPSRMHPPTFYLSVAVYVDGRKKINFPSSTITETDLVNGKIQLNEDNDDSTEGSRPRWVQGTIVLDIFNAHRVRVEVVRNTIGDPPSGGGATADYEDAEEGETHEG